MNAWASSRQHIFLALVAYLETKMVKTSINLPRKGKIGTKLQKEDRD